MDDATLARFLDKVEVQPNGCWHWTGSIHENGYGYFWFEGKNRLVHRFSFQQFVGDIPDNEELDHVCHTRDEACVGGPACLHRRCVNWSGNHLEPVTGYVNIMRSMGVAPANVAKEYCAHGHRLSGGNLYIYPDGSERGCKECRRAAWRRWRNGGVDTDSRHNGAKTHCDQGHEFTEENTYLIRGGAGGRACKTCRRTADAESKRKIRAEAKAVGLTAREYLASKRAR